MMNIFRASIAVVLILGSGLLGGSWTGRWGSSTALNSLAHRVESLPMTLGDWHGTPFELSAEDRRAVGATTYLARRYTNPKRGAAVTMLLLGGLPGRIAAHTPDICYSGAGYVLTPSAVLERRFGDARKAAFKTALAAREGPDPSVLRIFWSWNASKGWLAPAEPRWEFASEPALCKLYVVRETGASTADLEGDPSLEFLDVLLSELDRSVFTSSK
jgi:hypothetical protein